MNRSKCVYGCVNSLKGVPPSALFPQFWMYIIHMLQWCSDPKIMEIFQVSGSYLKISSPSEQNCDFRNFKIQNAKSISSHSFWARISKIDRHTPCTYVKSPTLDFVEFVILSSNNTNLKIWHQNYIKNVEILKIWILKSYF